MNKQKKQEKTIKLTQSLIKTIEKLNDLCAKNDWHNPEFAALEKQRREIVNDREKLA